LADLKPGVLEFHSLVKAGVERAKLVFVLNHLVSINEEAAAREYLKEAGYEVLNTGLKERVSYRQVQNEGLSVGEVNYKSLKKEVEQLVGEVVGRIK
jgi:chromosome partitioning protein